MVTEDPTATLLARAEVLIDAGRNRDAVALIRQARLADPQNARACCFHAMVHINLEEWKEACEPAEAAVRLQPDGEWGQRLRAIALLNLGRTKEALEAAEAALRVSPELREALHITLRCQWALGKKKEARETAERLLRVAPEWSPTHDFLGKMALDERKWKAAEPHYRRALQLNPQSWTAMNNLGLSLKGQGRRKEAIECFHQAARLDPQRALIKANLNQTVREHGESWLVAVLYIVGLVLATVIGTMNRHALPLGGAALFIVALASTVAAVRLQKRRLAELHPEVTRYVREEQLRQWAVDGRQTLVLLCGLAVWVSAGMWTAFAIRLGPKAAGLHSPWVLLYALDVLAALVLMGAFFPWLKREVERANRKR